MPESPGNVKKILEEMQFGAAELVTQSGLSL